MSALKVSQIDRTPLAIPFRDIPGQNMYREFPHWKYFELIEVELECGTVGIGETMTYYTWGNSDENAVNRALGENASELMWDDSLGAGLQMALFDAVGKAMSTPVSALLGNRVRDRVPLSWWCSDMPAEHWLSECQRAIENGYTSAKIKGRPWYDIRAQLEKLCEELPDWFALDIDFNDTLLTADKAIPLLTELEQYPQVERFETPIPQEDVQGNQRIKEEIDSELVLHYGTPDPETVIREDIVEGFVLIGGASRLVQEGAVASMADVPAWLQLVGTGLTASFSLHYNAVLDAAEWPAINCHQMFVDQLIEGPISVEDGYAVVPDGPGLGVTVDESQITRYQIEDPESKTTSKQVIDEERYSEFYSQMQTESRPSPPRLIESRWPDGTTMYFSGVNDQMLRYAQTEGNMPYFETGVETRLIPDDGSEQWSRLHEQALDEPVVFGPDSNHESPFNQG